MAVSPEIAKILTDLTKALDGVGKSDFAKSMIDLSKAGNQVAARAAVGGAAGAAAGGASGGGAGGVLAGLGKSILGISAATMAVSLANAAGEASLREANLQIAEQVGIRNPGAGARAAAEIGPNNAGQIAADAVKFVPGVGPWSRGVMNRWKDAAWMQQGAEATTATQSFYESQKVEQWQKNNEVTAQSINLDWNMTPQERQYQLNMQQALITGNFGADIGGARIAADEAIKATEASIKQGKKDGLGGPAMDALYTRLKTQKDLRSKLDSPAMQDLIKQNKETALQMEKNAETQYLQETFGRSAPEEQISPYQRATAPAFGGVPSLDARLPKRGDNTPGGLMEAVGRIIYSHELVDKKWWR